MIVVRFSTRSRGGAGSTANPSSKGWSLNARTELNEKNTTLVAGIAGTSDRIKVFYQPSWAQKHNIDLLAGVSQLLDPQTVVTVNVSWGRATGQFAIRWPMSTWVA